LNPANGHYYNAFDGSFDWNSANTAAQAQTFMGTQGHLVTILNAQENQFLTSAFGSAKLLGHWTGGMIFFPVIDPPGPGQAEPQGFPPPALTWVTGENAAYTNWAVGAPSYLIADLGRVLFANTVTADGQAWNDQSGTSPASGYVVEFDVAAAPEPGTAVLLGSGALTLAGYRWLRRRLRR
jgi:hypothetical protein